MGLRDRLLAQCDRYGVPGAAIAVTTVDDDDETVCVGSTSVEGGRPVDDETQFALGSITKPMTAELVLSLATDAVLGLDDPIADHLPELSSSAWADGITIRHLLSHASGSPLVQHQLAAFTGIPGLANPDPIEDDATLARWTSSLGDLDLLFRPGASVAYSNVAFRSPGASARP